MMDNDDAKRIRKDFPILAKDDDFVFLDNAASSQKPSSVIEAIKRYYEETNANIHRGVYGISEEAGRMYAESKKKVASFIVASPEEVVYTRNTTESINLVAYSLLRKLSKDSSGKKKIVLTKMEHHSNLVPWQQIAGEYGFELDFIGLGDDYNLDMDDAEKKIDDDTAIVALTHISNTLGTENDVKKITRMAHDKGAYVLIDAAQSVPHKKVSFSDIGCDFLAFSGHKMLGPMGIGVLVAKKEMLEELPPFNYGGDMIKDVNLNSSEWNETPMKFEAGTPNVAGAIGLSEAIDYLEDVGMDKIDAWEEELSEYALQELKKIDSVKIFRSSSATSGIISFVVDGVHHHDVAEFLSEKNICVRVGHHCTMPLMKELGVEGTIRLSLYLYNTYEDIDAFISELKETISMFKRR